MERLLEDMLSQHNATRQRAEQEFQEAKERDPQSVRRCPPNDGATDPFVGNPSPLFRARLSASAPRRARNPDDRV